MCSAHAPPRPPSPPSSPRPVGCQSDTTPFLNLAWAKVPFTIALSPSLSQPGGQPQASTPSPQCPWGSLDPHLSSQRARGQGHSTSPPTPPPLPRLPPTEATPRLQRTQRLPVTLPGASRASSHSRAHRGTQGSRPHRPSIRKWARGSGRWQHGTRRALGLPIATSLAQRCWSLVCCPCHLAQQ